MFSTGMDNKLRQWKISDNKTIREIDITGELFKLARAGREIFIPAADHRIRRFITKGNPKQIADFELADWAVSIAVSPDGKRLAAGGFNGQVRVWELATRKMLATFMALPGFK